MSKTTLLVVLLLTILALRFILHIGMYLIQKSIVEKETKDYISELDKWMKELLADEDMEAEEFSAEWMPVLADYGDASDLLKKSINDLIDKTEIDPFEIFFAYKIKDISVKMGEVAERRRMAARRFIELEKEVEKWRAVILTLEGAGENRLPVGISRVLPVPHTVGIRMRVQQKGLTRLNHRMGILSSMPVQSDHITFEVSRKPSGDQNV